jgi:hypothetical protein
LPPRSTHFSCRSSSQMPSVTTREVAAWSHRSGWRSSALRLRRSSRRYKPRARPASRWIRRAPPGRRRQDTCGREGRCASHSQTQQPPRLRAAGDGRLQARPLHPRPRPKCTVQFATVWLLKCMPLNPVKPKVYAFHASHGSSWSIGMHARRLCGACSMGAF